MRCQYCQRRTAFKMRLLTAALAVSVALFASVVRAVPSGFSEKKLFNNGFMNDITWDSQDRMFVIQKLGIVRMYEPGDDYEYDDKTTVLDIVDVVCYENERGLGGIQLHPNFAVNNYM